MYPLGKSTRSLQARSGLRQPLYVWFSLPFAHWFSASKTLALQRFQLWCASALAACQQRSTADSTYRRLSTAIASVAGTDMGPSLPRQRWQPALASQRPPLSRQPRPWGERPQSQGATFGPFRSAFPSSLKRLLKLACGRPRCCFVLPFYFIWHLFTCWGQGILQTKANHISRGTEWKKWYNLCWQNGNSICFPTAPSAALLLSHKAPTWLPNHDQACAAALILGLLAAS